MREKVLKQATDMGADGQEIDDGKYHGQLGYIDYRKGFRRESREPCPSRPLVLILTVSRPIKVRGAVAQLLHLQARAPCMRQPHARGQLAPQSAPTPAAHAFFRASLRREHVVSGEKQSGNHGPLRAPTNVRFTFVMDYKPDICKDYKVRPRVRLPTRPLLS